MSKFRWTQDLNNGDRVTMRPLTGFDYIPEGSIPVLQFYTEDTVLQDPLTGRTLTGPEIVDGIKRAVLVLTRAVVFYHERQDDGTFVDKRIVNKDPVDVDVEKEISVYEIPDGIQLEIMAASARKGGTGLPDLGKFPGERQGAPGDRGDGEGLREDAGGAPPGPPGRPEL